MGEPDRGCIILAAESETKWEWAALSIEAPKKYWWVAVIIVPVAIAVIQVAPDFLSKNESPEMSLAEWRRSVEEVREALRLSDDSLRETERSTPPSDSARDADDHLFSRFDPKVKPSRRLEALLREFASDFESHKWLSLLDFFDQEHVNAQLKMYLQDDFMFAHLGEPGQRSRNVVIKLYLYETMSLSSEDGPYALEKVRKIHFTDMKEDLPSFWSVRFEAESDGDETMSGGFFVDKTTLRFSGAWG